MSCSELMKTLKHCATLVMGNENIRSMNIKEIIVFNRNIICAKVFLQKFVNWAIYTILTNKNDVTGKRSVFHVLYSRVLLA